MLSFLGSAAGGAIIKAITGGLFDHVEKAWEAYVNKQITKEQLLEKMQEALLATFRDVEVAFADALAKTYASFMQTLAQSKLMQVAWTSVVFSQLFVLFWHQWVIPFIVFMKWVDKYPSSGATVEWAYLLVAGLLGMGPAVLRAGPAGPGALVDGLKRLVGK